MADRCAFFYGTLMAPQVLHRVLFGTTKPTTAQSSRLIIAPAILSHYIRHRVADCDYPAIVASTAVGACVRGTYVRNLTADDQWRLDLFEGSQYQRVKVRLRLLDEENRESAEVEAETYVWGDEMVGLEEREWDFEEFQREKMGKWVGYDDEYEAEVDEAVRGAKDPTGGRGVNGSISNMLDSNTRSEEQVLEAAI